MDQNVHFWKRNARMYLIDIDRNLESISACAHNPHLPLEGAEVGAARNYRNFLRSKNNNANCTSSRTKRKQQMGCIRFFSRF